MKAVSPMWIYLIALAFGFIPLWIWSKQRPVKLPPGPLSWPLLNNLPSLSLNEKFRESLSVIHDKYGPIISINMGFGFWNVFVQGPELVREVLLDSRFAGRSLFSFFTVMKFENSITFGQGQQWKERKKVFLQVMRSLGVGRSVFAMGVEQEVQRLLQCLEEHDGQVVNIKVRVRLAKFQVPIFIRTSNFFLLTRLLFETLGKGSFFTPH